MPQTVTGVNLIAIKQASGNVKMIFQNDVGGILFSAVIPSADFTALNTTVNGGSTGATLNKKYNEDQNKDDYDKH